VRAIGSAAIRGRVTSGASTLTMQTARLLEPRPRNIGSKLIEMVRAMQLEARLSKREILALYLTLAPYGGNLEGVRAASLSYFGHEPESLTNGEQALLIALPQAPEGRRPDRFPDTARRARDAVLGRMIRAGMISEAAGHEAETEALPRRSPFPTNAWHISGQLARGAEQKTASVLSTIDAGLQARLEPLAASYARSQGAEATAAILVVEIEGRAVRAVVGSAGLDRPGGWIDMTRAVRSPGSALKPFIYAMAFDDGKAAPDTRIQDVATRFKDYQPENFDRVFRGEVTASEALAHSLNVPAVAMMEKIGPRSFLGRLENVGVELVRPETGRPDPGLAIALGGEGITLRDLAVLYCALGDEGLAKPLAFTEADARRNGRARPGLQDRHLLRLPRRRGGGGGRRLCDHRLDRPRRWRGAGWFDRAGGVPAPAVRRRRPRRGTAERAAADRAEGGADGPAAPGEGRGGTETDLPAGQGDGAGRGLRADIAGPCAGGRRRGA